MSVDALHGGAAAKPYKGPESYQAEDAQLFFGREREAEQLITRILSSRFTIVHAQSGAGKTSLLNARIIPGLERRGWGACRILPQDDPVLSTRVTAVGYILPHPLTEQAGVTRAVESLAHEGEDPTLDELLARYDELEVKDPRRRALITPLPQPAGAAGATETAAAVTPYFCRLLRSSIEIEELAEHVEAIRKHGDEDARRSPPVTGASRASELVGLFSDEAFLFAYEGLLNELKTPGRDLAAFFQQLADVYGRRRTRFALVLILDQFEEMFTRFVDQGAFAPEHSTGLLDWRLRREFFEQLERLYGPAPGAADAGAALPLRYVISMRDEYIAQMEPLRRFIWGAEECLFHLNLLGKEEAAEAVREPAKFFGYTYEGECFGRIITQLTKEDRFIEPAHLQLVCEKLWNEQGRDLVAGGDGASEEDMPFVTLKVFERLGETKGILKSFFKDFLVGLSVREREEVLEMLEPLVTAGGTRNIVERGRLLTAPFRDSELRRRLLDRLVNRTIVRTEPRLGGHFVEITHEFLITPILEENSQLWAADPDYRRRRLIFSKLERILGSELAGFESPLSPAEFAALHGMRDNLYWNAWGAELMLRTAIQHGASEEELRVWLKEFGERRVEPKPGAVGAEAFGKVRELLGLAELRAAEAHLRAAPDLVAAQARLMLRSVLFWATDDERKWVIEWAKRMVKLDE